MNISRSGREAIILAGGFGTRLKHVVSDVPKPMAQVAGRPFLRFLLDSLAENDFGRIIIADGYKKECIEKYFGSSYRGMELVFSSEDEPLLTGGATKKALSLCKNDWVYVLNGDTFLDVDYGSFESSVKGAPQSFDAVIAVKEMHCFDRYGSIRFSKETSEVIGFDEKKYKDSAYINAGIYYLKRNLLNDFPVSFSLEKEFFEKRVNDQTFGCVVTEGVFIDIGVPEDYARAQVLLAPFTRKWKVAFFDRDGTINVDTGHLFEPERLKLIESTIQRIKHYNNLDDYKVVVVTNQAGIAKGLYSTDQMKNLHLELNRRLCEQGARIDAFYYCPHHPDYTGECECRKPNAGMIKKALFDFEALAEECIMFGDSKVDESAAKAANVRFEFVTEDERK